MLEAPGFGRIVFEGRVYDHDIVVCRGSVAPRRKDLSAKRRSVYGHTPLTRDELEKYLSECPEVDTLVIAAGYYGDLPIEPDAIVFALKHLERVLIVKTVDLPKLGIDLGRALVLVHVTC